MLYPAEKSNELIDAINLMVESGVSDLKIASIRRDALKLEQAGKYIDAKQVLGMLATFQGDIEAVDHNFNAAVNASGQDPLVLMNYAASLANLRCFRRAVEVVDRAVARAPDALEGLAEAVNVHLDAFDTDGARRLLERLRLLGKDIPQGDSVINERMRVRDRILEENRLAWEDVAARIELASGVLKARGFPPIASPALEIEGDGALLYEFQLRASATEAAEAEEAILQTIANLPYSPVDNAIVFYCLPA